MHLDVPGKPVTQPPYGFAIPMRFVSFSRENVYMVEDMNQNSTEGQVQMTGDMQDSDKDTRKGREERPGQREIVNSERDKG